MQMARVVFGRDGYSRTSIDRLAAEAGMSTRTIYNHFPNKKTLFDHVLRDSATKVADRFEQDLAGIEHDDPRDQLIAVGVALTTLEIENPDHFDMVRQIVPEARHVGPRSLKRWQNAGPTRVVDAIAEMLREMSKRGDVRFPDPRLAALQFTALTTVEVMRTWYEPVGADPERVAASVTAGVDVFLNGYTVRD